MRKLVVGTFVTLDGVLQAPGGPEEDRSGGFAHGGWVVPYFDDKRWARSWWTGSGGRAGSCWVARPMRSSGPLAPRDRRSDRREAEQRAQICGVENAGPREVQPRDADQGDVAEAVRRLKSDPDGELQFHGSGDLIQTLLKHRLIDELRLSPPTTPMATAG
jgi:hypothetical protein